MSPNNRRSRSLSPLEVRSSQITRKHHPKLPDCRICRQDHPLRTCRKFQNMNVSKKIKIIKKHRYCENCLAHSHSLWKCRSSERCRKCGGKHHTLLHRHERLRTNEQQSSSINQCLTRLNPMILIPTVIISMQLGKEWGKIRGVLNPSEEISQIADFLPDRYNLPIEKTGSTRLCKITFRPHFKDEPTFVLTVKVTSGLPRKLRSEDLDNRIAEPYKNLRLADPHFFKSCDINIVLGADIYPKIVKSIIQPETITGPMAQDTHLGWTLIGKIGM